MKKIIYHGSINIIKEPIYGYGKKYNDYGLGFYCTENIELAKEWAVNKDKDGYSNIYELDISDLKILNLNDKKYNILHWLTLLIKNREFDLRTILSKRAKEYLIKNYSIDLNGIDIVIGYRADDSYFTFAQDFLNNSISLRKLNEAMRLGDLGEQIVLISKKAFNNVKYIGNEIAYSNIYYVLKNIRDLTARKYYFNKREELNDDDIFMSDIIRGKDKDE
mgnify:CR=1 FL=1